MEQIKENDANKNNIDEKIINENEEKENSINENDLLNTGNNTVKCIQNLSLLLDNIKENIKNNKKMKENEFLLNLLLVAWDLNIDTKIFCLYLLSDLYNFNKNLQMLLHIANKVIKYSSKDISEESKKLITNILYKTSSFLFLEKKYYSSYQYIIISNNFITETQNNYFSDLKQKIIENIKLEIDNKLNYFKSEENQKEFEDINNIINNIENICDIKEDYLYAINKNWVNKAKLFLECFLESKQKGELDELYKESFNLENILNNYFIEDINKININKYPFYPGPINNIPLISSKDYWNEKEDSDFISSDNHYLIENEKLDKLTNVFSATNEIKKKTSKLMELKIILFHQQMKSLYGTENILKQKSISIEQNSKLGDLKVKINKIIDFNFHNTDETHFKFYVINKKYKHILFEIGIAYVNKIPFYDSLFINELKEDDETKLNDIIEKYNQKNFFLIVEIYTKENEQFLKQINPKILNNSIICKCSLCNSEIKLNDRNKCDKCNMSIYCSIDCSQNNNHIKLHKSFNVMLYNFHLDEFLNDDLSSFYKNIKNLNKGRVGLSNLGNTCYMNASLQCLSNTKDFTKYFINKLDEPILNYDNRINTAEGLVTKEFSKLINDMWLSEEGVINPIDFRKSFIQLYPAFNNHVQQDSQEFLSTLLNYLHIGLSRNSHSNDLDFYKQESIISDLFQGEFKNIIKCQKCNQVKIKNEKYMFLSLPIPEKHENYKFKFFNQKTCVIFDMKIDENTTIKDVILKSTDYLSKEIRDALDDIYIDSNCENDDYIEYLRLNSIDILILDSDKKLINIYDSNNRPEDLLDKRIINFIGDNEICFYERDVVNYVNYNIYVYPIYNDVKSDKDYYLSYPVPFSVKQNNITFEDLENMIIKRFEILVTEKNIKNKINLNILHSSKPSTEGLFSFLGEKKKCIFCGNDYDQILFCPLYYSVRRSDSILSLVERTKSEEHIILMARSSYYNITKPVYKELYTDKFVKDTEFNKNLNIYESLDLFEREEILEKDNILFCENCKNNQIATKNIKISKLPLYLVIQLKRFKQKDDGFFSFLSGDKIDKFVYYPTINLNMKKYCDDSDNNSSYEYNLYGVINHYSLGEFKHYTSICKNNNAWVTYNDAEFSDAKTPLSKDAYLLFYIKKEIDK